MKKKKKKKGKRKKKTGWKDEKWKEKETWHANVTREGRKVHRFP